MFLSNEKYKESLAKVIGTHKIDIISLSLNQQAKLAMLADSFVRDLTCSELDVSASIGHRAMTTNIRRQQNRPALFSCNCASTAEGYVRLGLTKDGPLQLAQKLFGGPDKGLSANSKF